MSISFPGSVAPTSSAGTVFQSGAPLASSTIVGANAARLLGGTIVNNTNKKLWLRFDATPAVLAFPCLMVPPGGNIDIEPGYVGPVTGIVEAGATGTIDGVQFLG